MQQNTNNLKSTRLQANQLAQALDSFKLDELPTLSHSYDRDHDTTNLSSDTMTTQGNNKAWLEAIELANYLSSDEGEAVQQELKTSRNTRAKRHSRRGNREATRTRGEQRNATPKSRRKRPTVSLPSLSTI